jgi:hypothetical protein
VNIGQSCASNLNYGDGAGNYSPSCGELSAESVPRERVFSNLFPKNRDYPEIIQIWIIGRHGPQLNGTNQISNGP